MKGIPVPYLRANQIGIVSLVIISIIAKQPLLIAVLWVIPYSKIPYRIERTVSF